MPHLVMWPSRRGGPKMLLHSGWACATGNGPTVCRQLPTADRSLKRLLVAVNPSDLTPRSARASSVDAFDSVAHALNVVVVYGDTRTRERALRVYDHLVEELSGDFSIQFTWWKFDFLRCPDMFEAAVKAAFEADLIVFSVHAAEKLPPWVQDWIEAWRGKREPNRGALVALIGESQIANKAAPVQTLLHEVANASGMEFFPHSFQLLSEPSGITPSHPDRVSRFTPLLEDILTRGPNTRHFGINE